MNPPMMNLLTETPLPQVGHPMAKHAGDYIVVFQEGVGAGFPSLVSLSESSLSVPEYWISRGRADFGPIAINFHECVASNPVYERNMRYANLWKADPFETDTLMLEWFKVFRFVQGPLEGRMVLAFGPFSRCKDLAVKETYKQCVRTCLANFPGRKVSTMNITARWAVTTSRDRLVSAAAPTIAPGTHLIPAGTEEKKDN